MKTAMARVSGFLMLALLLPVLYGCNSGGEGDGASLGTLLGDGGSVTATATEDGNNDVDQLAAVATVANPEPATVLLLGGGILAAGYVQRKKKR